MIETNRRSLLVGLGGLIAAPAICKALRRVIRGCNKASRIGGALSLIRVSLGDFSQHSAISMPGA